MNEECSNQADRLINMKEKFCDVVRMCCLEERRENEILNEKLDFVQNQIRDIEDSTNECKNDRRKFTRRFLSKESIKQFSK